MKNLYLVNIIHKDLTKTPLFITDDSTFGINYFNQWKKQQAKEDLLCQVEPIEFINSSDFTKTDIQMSTLGDTDGIPNEN